MQKQREVKIYGGLFYRCSIGRQDMNSHKQPIVNYSKSFVFYEITGHWESSLSARAFIIFSFITNF